MSTENLNKLARYLRQHPQCALCWRPDPTAHRAGHGGYVITRINAEDDYDAMTLHGLVDELPEVPPMTPEALTEALRQRVQQLIGLSELEMRSVAESACADPIDLQRHAVSAFHRGDVWASLLHTAARNILQAAAQEAL